MIKDVRLSFPEFSQLCGTAYFKDDAAATVVLLHGFPENGGLWNNMLPQLTAKYNILVPDLPGAGESSLPTEPLSVESMAAAVLLLLDETFPESKVIMAGHSMGGYTALAFARRYPERVKGLSLVHSTALPDDAARKETRQKAIKLVQQDGGKAAFLKTMVPGAYSATFKAAHPDVMANQLERGMQLSAESIAAFYTAMMNRTDTTNVISDAAFPVQFVVGKEDGIITLKSILPQTHLPQISFIHTYNEVAHMSMMEQPTLLTKDLTTFIDYCH